MFMSKFNSWVKGVDFVDIFREGKFPMRPEEKILSIYLEYIRGLRVLSSRNCPSEFAMKPLAYTGVILVPVRWRCRGFAGKTGYRR